MPLLTSAACSDWFHQSRNDSGEVQSLLTGMKGVPFLGAGHDDALAFYGNLKGPGRSQVLERDARVRRFKDSREKDDPNYQQLLTAFRNSPMTGLTTLLDLAREKSGYNPLATDNANVTEKRLAYLVELISCPLFTSESFGHAFALDPSKPGNGVGDLVSQFIGDDPIAAPVLRAEIDSTMRAALSNIGHAQKSDLMMEYKLGADDRYSFTMAMSSVQLAVVMLPPMKYLIQGNGQRSGFALAFNAVEWPNYAEQTLDQHLKNVTDWLKENSTIR